MQLQSREFVAREFVVRPEVSRHVIIKPDPRPFNPVRPVTVPEGGSTLLFLLAALTDTASELVETLRLRRLLARQRRANRSKFHQTQLSA